MTSPINANNESDYNTQSTDLFNLLPGPYKSDTNRSVMSNLFNRYLSKDETTQIIGYVGDGNPNAVFIRKIVEPTVHRAGWQLQPLLYTKIGSIEFITSWYDILDELTAQGVNIDNLPVWGNATVYNWAPPIDINKIVNFQDYYWYDTTTPNSSPQYITVKSVCAQATALVTFFQQLIDQYGANFDILQVIPSINGILVQGNQTLLFDAGFIFFIQNSPNVQLNNTFQTVVSSSYDSSSNLTTIVINETITNNLAGGQITLTEQLQIYQNLQACECANSAGWDIQPWDDNQANQPPPVWNTAVLADISYPTLTAWNVNHPTPQLNDIWYDTTNDILWSLQNPSGASNIVNWKTIYVHFSLILLQTTGTAYWDLSTGCAGSSATITGLNQWIVQNKWVHKTDVQNFTIAKRAQAPIIEFEPQLELNEWTSTTYNWQYRASNVVPFLSVTTQPTRFELEPINIYTHTANTFIIDERFGDLTSTFVPGFGFTVAAFNTPYVVASSTYQRSSLPSGAFQTQVVVTTPILGVLIPTTNYLQPEKTSMGDSFKGYGQQWLFNGINTTTAINHQAENTMDDPSGEPIITDPSGNFTYQVAPYAEQFNLLVNGITTLTLSTSTPPGSTRSLQQHALVGFDDIRVYRNGIRQYGSYDELGTVFVTGVTFHKPLVAADIVVIVVGEAAFNDFGNYAILVRTIANDTLYATFGNTLVSLIQLRKAEQIKTATNQYPLFDIYLTNSNTADIANQIFAYHDDPSGILYPYLSQRVVTRADGSLEFVNELVRTNNGQMYAYRNYNESKSLYWYNPVTQVLLVWNGFTWTSKYEASGYYTTPQVLSALPNPATTPIGFLVFNTTNNTLYIRSNTPTFWTVETSIFISTTDQTLQTIWRHGLNNEQAVPARQDWLRRSYPEYVAQYNQFITTTTTQLLITNPSWTEAEAQTVANQQWTEIQERSINQAWYSVPDTQRIPANTGLWCGQWQVPDPMYFNVSHADYQYVSTRDLLSHFRGIVDAQPLYPGFNGQPSANWNLIAYTNINWGLGGTIHEYDNSFDTFLSSQYTNVVTPSTLFGFAQSEYGNIIVTLGQTFQRNAVSLLTQTDTTTILTPQVTVANSVILVYEENEAANLVYGDSTTYAQAVLSSTGAVITPAKGILNWIATLPYFGIIPKTVPYADFDTDRGINAVVHHDGHRASYTIPPITINGLQTQIANTIDPRIVLPATPEKIGRISVNPPPATQAAFISQFSSHLRTGVYWLQTTTQTLFRMVAFVQTATPATTFPEQTYWWNTTGTGTLNVLELLNGTKIWVPISGNLTPAWQPVNLNQIYADIVVQAETMLYDNVPPAPLVPPINFAALQAANPIVWNQLLQQQFNNYVREAQITSPFANNTFDPSNPFTWNYKYSSTNLEPRSGTILSGGTWQDVYQKAYGTPYPHLEPWALQGWTSKPTWWDATFVNDNAFVYGQRRWKYLHSLPITAVGVNTLTFNIGLANPGNQFIQKVFKDFDQFTVYTNTSHFTYFVQSVTFAAGNTIVTTTTPIDPSITTSDTVAIGLWDYIIRGATLNGQTPPTISPPSYAYVSVNISSTQIFVDGTQTYEADDVFPPYWNLFAHSAQLTLPQDIYIRSFFTDTSVEVISENADYVFGDAGPVEWAWRDSTFYTYSLLTISYLIQPVRTIQSIFGIVFEYIDGLPIDSLTGQVFSHENTQFHGEITTSNQLVKVNGINQWYVNYLRAHGFDTSYSDFRTMWTTWTAPLAHQFDATIDTSSFQIDHRIVEIAPSDYELTMKKSPAVSNTWVDAFNVRIVSMPPIQSLFDTESQWILNVDSLAPITRTISYYDVKLYDYYVNPTTSVCSLYTYPIVAASPVESSFTVNGDVSGVFGGNSGASQFTVTNNPANNGTYTVVSATFDPVAQQTTIVVSNTVPSTMLGGLLAAINYRTLPWTTGDLVAVATTEIAPLPLDVSKQYFIIVLSPTTFKLALTQLDAIANITIAFTSPAYGIQRVGQLYNTFQALSGQNVPTFWSHYAIDTSIIKTFTTPYQFTGMQTWINILDGYAAYITAQGFGVNVDGSYIDPQTGQHVSWQNELERFINWSYIQRSVRRQRINDKYSVNVDYATAQFTYTSQNPQFVVGSPVVVWAFGGGLPPPLINGQSYYVFNNNNGTVSLASSRTNALAGIPIQVTYTGAVGQLYLSAAALYLAEIPTYEINPFRNALWYSPPDGVVSNVVTGPFADITTQQLLFDQYGRKLAPGDIRVFRQDKITQIQFAGGVFNDVIALNNSQQNPYLYLHLGGGNIFVDTYEHVILFNDYTALGALIYDPFLGVNVTKFELDFYEQDVETQRPNVGGYFLSTNYNQGANLVRNLEATVTDLRYAYDTYQVPETLPIVKRARATLDYPGSVAYLKEINLTPKSQFLFWLGSLHAKGSVNAITAFINSRLFVSANVDQFWAFQVAQFGSAAEQEYLSLLLQTTDTTTNQLRLEFISSSEICTPGYQSETFGDENCGYANPESGSILTFNTDPTFSPILSTDQTRWFQQPEQLATLQPDGGVLYFNLKAKQKLVVYPVTIGPTTFIPYGLSVVTDPTSPLFPTNLTNEVAVIAFDPTNNTLQPSQQNPYTFWYWTTADGGYWVYGGGWNPNIGESPILRHDFMADLIQMTMSWYSKGFTTTYVIPSLPANTLELNISPYLPLTNSLAVFEDGVQLQPGADYVESLELFPGSTILGYKLYFQESISGSTLKVVYGPSQLNSELQFQTINTNIVQLLSQELVSHLFANNFTLTLWGLESNKEAQNPAKIIDEIAQVVLSPVSFWDPARGYQYYQALHSIDIQTDSDPAIYDPLDGWKNQEVGKTWLDTTNVAYVPYYDPYVITDQSARLADWGQLAAYGKPRIFQWVSSPVAPADYNTLAAAQENDSSINPAIRLSGTVRQDVRFRTRANTSVQVTVAASGNTKFLFNNTIVSTDPTGITTSQGPITGTTGIVGGSAYTNGTYTNVPLTGGTGIGAIATVVVGGTNIAALGTITGGTGYVDGTYPNVPLTGGTGSNAAANIIVSGGIVTSVILINNGTEYTVSDVLSADNSHLGGTGTGLLIPISAIGQTVVAVTITNGGTGYTVFNVLSANDANIGGTGIGFAVTVSSVNTTYQFTITVNGTLIRTIAVAGSQVLTFGSLMTTLNVHLNPLGVTASLSGNTITITSNLTGATSSVVIVQPVINGLFNSLINLATQTVTTGNDQSIQIANPSEFVVGESVLFSSTGTLPTGIDSGTKYVITTIVGNHITLTNVILSSVGSGTLTMVSAAFPTTWIIDQQITTDLDPLIDAASSVTSDDVTTYTFDLANCVDPTQDYAIPLFDVGDTVNIYVNGAFKQSYTLAAGASPWPVSLALNAAGRVTVILPIHTPTSEELAFDPSVSDDGTVIIQWQFITNYNAVQTINTTTQQQQFTYYFWVENVSTVATNSTREPPINAVADIITPPQPWMFFNKLAPAQTTTNPQTGQTILLPDRFVQAVVHGLRGFVDSDNRYVLRFTRDFTLRDNLNFGDTPLQLKDTHQEWLMFRQAQLGNIPRSLWDKITESMVGFLLTDPNVRVPSLDRQLYDAQFSTSTEYGLGQDQAFVNGPLALATVQAYLNNPANNFYPVDLDQFFAQYDFNTPQDIIAAMNAIYTTFSYTNVNNIFFSVLQDALTTQLQYAGLMKTSAVALYGVELLNVQGVFDD